MDRHAHRRQSTKPSRSILATLLRGLANDVFFQVGLLTTVGLSAKNAILIVEFAKENHDKGMELIEATVHAARQRLRPILMTSLAFMLGVLPLAISGGAGSGGRSRWRCESLSVRFPKLGRSVWAWCSGSRATTLTRCTT